jgi:hypothetical protein
MVPAKRGSPLAGLAQWDDPQRSSGVLGLVRSLRIGRGNLPFGGARARHLREVGASVDFLELPDADLGLNLGRGEAGVAEQLLDIADIRPVLEHERGAGVAEEVAASLLADLGGAHVGGDHGAQVFDLPGPAPVAEEEGPLVGVVGPSLAPENLSGRDRPKKIPQMTPAVYPAPSGTPAAPRRLLAQRRQGFALSETREPMDRARPQRSPHPERCRRGGRSG